MRDFTEVRQKLGGLKGLMRMMGDAPSGERWSSMPKCPFCDAKGGKAALFGKEGAEKFKCHAPSCPTGGEVFTEVGYIAFKEGLSDAKPSGGGASPAYERLLRLAGLWEDPKPKAEPKRVEEKRDEAVKPVVPETAAETTPLPARPEAPLDEKMVEYATILVRLHNSTSVRLLQEKMQIGQAKVVALLNELQKRGVVGPPRLKSAREVLPYENQRADTSPLPSPHSAAEAERGEGVKKQIDLPAGAGPERDGSVAPAEQALSPLAQTVCEAIEVLRPLAPGSPALASRLVSYLAIAEPMAVAILGKLRTDGVISQDNAIVKLPDKPAQLVVFFLEGKYSFEWLKPLAGTSVPPVKPASSPATSEAAPASADVKPLRPGLRALRWYFDQLPPTDVQMMPFLFGEKVPDPLTNEALRKLKFKPVPFYEKRGITPLTCELLAFRGNPRTNMDVLQRMPDLFDWEELEMSGLWLPADAKRKLPRRPNPQFCGKGQVGKKPENERRDNDDKWQWAWCEPVLIPYFDANGELVKLRPHKGGAKGHTAAGCERIFVPRRFKSAGDVVEQFSDVVICEGEFKAVAIWQTIGGGADDLFGQPVMGVCALPGITFAKSVDMREELDDWLREVGAKRVYVAFDDEDNSKRPLRQRFDAQVYARYLAVDLQKKLHVQALVVSLPREWRNEKGKADWDGALAKLVQAESVLTPEPPPMEDGPPETMVPPEYEDGVE